MSDLFLHNIYLIILALGIEALVLSVALIRSRIIIYLAVGSSVV